MAKMTKAGQAVRAPNTISVVRKVSFDGACCSEMMVLLETLENREKDHPFSIRFFDSEVALVTRGHEDSPIAFCPWCAEGIKFVLEAM